MGIQFNNKNINTCKIIFEEIQFFEILYFNLIIKQKIFQNGEE